LGAAHTLLQDCEHQFVSVSFSAEYLRTRLANGAVPLHPCLSELIRSDAYHSFLGPVQPLNSRLHQIALNLREPPVCRAAREWWYEGKALELAAELLVAAPTDTDHVTRQGEVNRERAARVVQILKETLAQPPSLRELGRRVGCSHYHLSRIFSEVMGMTISQHLRQLRLERAAELLATRRCNVTEAALEVGYSSLSHFSQAFHEEYGCCPGLYPLATHTQRVSWKT
jgi:AraC-like DNA-binding protein